MTAPDPTREELLEAAAEVWESVPATYDPNDPMVQRHAAALNALGRLLARAGRVEVIEDDGARRVVGRWR